MTTGIYTLSYEQQGLFYIGQSVEIETRFTRHLWELKKGRHSNYKLQNAYNLHGIPTLTIIEACSSQELNAKEILWTNEFDSINSGLNIVEAGNSSSGTSARNSKYSKISILRVFSLLYNTDKSSKDISVLTNVSISVISDIMAGKSHHWLQEAYPEQYSRMQRNTKLRCINRQKGILISLRYRGKLVSPSGSIIEVSVNLHDFAREYKRLFKSTNIKTIAQGIGRVLNGNRLSYDSWYKYS